MIKTRQCQECGELTDRFEHCTRRGHQLIPQTDTSVDTVPVLVQVVDYLCHPRMWVDAERRERECSRGTKGCEVEHPDTTPMFPLPEMDYGLKGPDDQVQRSPIL